MGFGMGSCFCVMPKKDVIKCLIAAHTRICIYVSKSVFKCISHSFLADTYSKFFRIKIGFKPTIVDNELHSFEYIWFKISLWGAINSDCVGLGLQTGINKPQQARKPISINHLADNRTLSWLPTKCNNIKKGKEGANENNSESLNLVFVLGISFTANCLIVMVEVDLCSKVKLKVLAKSIIKTGSYNKW